MSRKKTVKINYPNLKEAINKNFHKNNTLFCIAMGLENRTSWVSDLKRGRNLPSPEEAVLMCAILHTTPEEILTEPADIALVNELIGQERAKQDIKKDLPQGEVELSDIRKEAWEYIQRLDNEQLRKFIAAAKALLGE